MFVFAALTPAGAQQIQPGGPEANPGRPTVSTPATLTPTGYFQFETGLLNGWDSPGLSSQSSINEVIKFSVARRLELLVSTQPYAHSHAAGEPANAAGDVDLGFQAMVHEGEGARPTIARRTLVFDGGFDRGLTSTSTRWELFAGFTYLLPHRLWRPKMELAAEHASF